MLDELRFLRKMCLQASNVGRDGNLQSVFSSLEIMWTLYHRVMNWRVEEALSPDRDYFVLSKGQSTLGLHAILTEAGLFNVEEFMTFGKHDSRFSMQADRTKFPEGGIENSAGSLGHGFPIAVGMALAHKIRDMNNRFFVLVGDGELNEGTMWEAMILASSKHLDNLCVIVDDNDSIGKMVALDNLSDRISAFGFAVAECDGHNPDALANEFNNLAVTAREKNCPSCLIAKTRRGYGSQTLMTDKSWFHRSPDAAELAMLIEEVYTFCENK